MSGKLPLDDGSLTAAEQFSCDSVDPTMEEHGLTPAQQAELTRRWEEHLRDPDEGETWDVVVAEIQAVLAADRASAA